MQTRPYIPFIAEEAIERAFAIAFDYIARTRDLEDVATAQEFIADALVQLLQRGERHPIRLANLTISRYERAHDCAPMKAQRPGSPQVLRERT